MKMISVKRTIPTATLPSGNPFDVYPPEDMLIGWMTAPIWTGLLFDVPEDVTFQAFPLIKNLVVVGCGQSERGLHIAVMCVEGEADLKSHIPFASVSIVKREAVPVRFVESDGKIIIAPPSSPKEDEGNTTSPVTPVEPVKITPVQPPPPYEPWKLPQDPNVSPYTNPYGSPWVTNGGKKNPWDLNYWAGADANKMRAVLTYYMESLNKRQCL